MPTECIYAMCVALKKKKSAMIYLNSINRLFFIKQNISFSVRQKLNL